MTLAQEGTALRGIEDVEFVAWVTGPELSNRTDANYDVDGTDLGSMVDLEGMVYIAFGDTFGCCRPIGAEPAARTGAGMRWHTPPTVIWTTASPLMA